MYHRDRLALMVTVYNIFDEEETQPPTYFDTTRKMEIRESDHDGGYGSNACLHHR